MVVRSPIIRIYNTPTAQIFQFHFFFHISSASSSQDAKRNQELEARGVRLEAARLKELESSLQLRIREVSARELQLSARLDELKNTVNLKGFRPGRVPVGHLRKVYGRSVMAEILQQTVDESTLMACCRSIVLKNSVSGSS